MGLGRSVGDLSDLTLERRLEEFAPGEVGPGVTQDRHRAPREPPGEGVAGVPRLCSGPEF